MKPLIGIPCRTLVAATGEVRFGVLSTYTRAVDLAGGAPVLIPLQLGEDTLRGIFERLDGVLLAGGADIHPQEFGQERLPVCGDVDSARDAAELRLTRWTLAEDKPVFGICRGIQMLNVAAGGSLYQDIPSELPTAIAHDHHEGDAYNRPAHPVEIESDSRLARALGATRVAVNSLHHQALKQLAPGFHIVARAPDGVIEAVESANGGFALGVQFHPEWLLDDDARMLRLFEEFVASARQHLDAR